MEVDEIKESLSNDLTIKMTPKELEACLFYQHESGAIIYDEREELRNFVILDPKWPLRELSELVKKGKKMNNTGKLFHSTFVVSQSLVDLHLSEVINLKDTGRELFISFLQRQHCLCCPCVYDQHGETVVPNFYLVPSTLETHSTGGILERLLHNEHAISLRYHFKSIPLLTPIFHRLVGSALTAWQVAYHNGKEVLTNKLCAFILDNFHRVVLTVDTDKITVTICNRQGNININPSICQNVQQYLTRNLHLILDIGFGLKGTTTDNKCFITAVSTCNFSSPCYKPLKDLMSQEIWRCDFHQIYGQSKDIMRVWFTHEEPKLLMDDTDYCATDCQGLSAAHLSETPSEVVIGRFVRRLDTDNIKQMAIKLGLANSIANLIEKEHREDTWKLGFHFLNEAVALHSKTYGDLVSVLDECNQDVHLLCRVMKRQKHSDPHIVADRVDTPITTQELASVAGNISNDGFSLGIELGISTNDIRRIMENIQEEEETLVLRKILLEWKRKLTSNATFRVLSSALSEVKLDSLCILNSVNVHKYRDLY